MILPYGTDGGIEDPVRIIIDGKLSVSMESRVFGGESRVIVLTTSSAASEKVKAFQSKGIEVIFADSDTEGCVDLEAAMIGLAVKGSTASFLKVERKRRQPLLKRVL